MNSALSKIRKLKGRSFDELRLRSRQALISRAELYGLSDRTRVPTDTEFLRLLAGPTTAESWLDHFRSRATPRFFAAFQDRDATVSAWLNRWPNVIQQTVARAERIGLGHFDLLGFTDLDFGAPVDWHWEPLSRKRAPLKHWSQIDELASEQTGDKKIVWELNRHQHFVTLGRAYWCTGDERYAEIFAEQLRGWMDQNPPAVGVNWISNLEVAFRSISWIWALYYFRDSRALTPELFLEASKFLLLHGQH